MAVLICICELKGYNVLLTQIVNKKKTEKGCDIEFLFLASIFYISRSPTACTTDQFLFISSFWCAIWSFGYMPV